MKIILICLLLIGCAYAAGENEEDFALKFLSRYGYLSAKTKFADGTNEKQSAIQNMQKFAGLEVTGKLDKNTIEKMHSRRCGVADEAQHQEMNLHPDDYRFSKNKWQRTNLTFKIIRYTVDQTIAEIRDAIERAMDVWSYVTPLTFTEVDQDTDADIKITFVFRKHDGCKYTLDGPGGLWGHTYYPTDGRIHMDDDEDWTVGTRSGTNLYYAMAHELGHALGLYHSSHSEDIMYGYTQGSYQGKYMKIPQGDRERIQMLYGAVTHCEERRIDYRVSSGVYKIDNVATWEACSRLCRDHVTCKYWSWTDAGAQKSNDFKCVLKGSNDGRISAVETTSGARDCGPAFTEWTAWSTCCEGIQRSGRTCPYQARHYICQGERTRTQTCDSQAACPHSSLAWNCWNTDCAAVLQRGLNPNYSFNGWTPLHQASQYARAEKAEDLLKYGANPDAKSDKYGQTPLMFAGRKMSNKGASTAAALIANGASLDVTNWKGYTALMYAVENPNQESAKVLLACGANRDIRNNDGETAEEMIKHLYGRWTQGAIDSLKDAFKNPGPCLASSS